MSEISNLFQSDRSRVFVHQLECGDRWLSGKLIQRLTSDIRDDMALLLLDEPLYPNDYPTHIERNHLLIATRWQGETLFPISRWNMSVYVCNPTVERIAGTSVIDSNSIQISDWAEICQHEGQCDNQIRSGLIQAIRKDQAEALQSRKINQAK
jgi:hypothetical protein